MAERKVLAGLRACGHTAIDPSHSLCPLMTNYAAFNASRDDYADARGVMLPAVSLSQYGATLAKWFGASDADLNQVFPTLPNFSARNLGFML